MSQFSNRKNKNYGFTLVEMLVSLGIMVTLLAVIIPSQQAYTEALALNNQADNLGLTISQAQAYGLATQERLIGTADFSAAYGISLSILESGNELGYIFFADINEDIDDSGYYDGSWSCVVGPSAECIKKVVFTSGIIIDDLCIVRNSGPDQCNVVNRADITFRRPNPAAKLFLFNPGGNEYSPGNMKGIKLILKSPRGLTRSVIVYETGQISVQ